MADNLNYLNSGLSLGNSGLNIYQGATSGNPVGQARAGLQGAKLYSNLTGNSDLNTDATGALDALGVYQGLQRGGVQGYGQALGSGLQGAGLLMNNPALSTAGGYVMAPLALYNFANNWKSGATGSDALNGAEAGAAVGSVIPGIGTVVGGLVGGAAGALSSAFGPGAVDPESRDVQQVINATSSNGNNPAVAAQASDPYLELAGLMDRHSSTLPMYQQYGRMGEQSFTNDLVGKINQAVQQNPSLAKDPNAVYNQVVAPWVNGMGSGYNNVGQAYTATTQGLLQDMVNQYMSGQAAQDWRAVGGDEPFQNIYQNSPFSAQAQQFTQQLAQEQAAQQAQTQAEQTRENANAARRYMAAKGGTVNRSLYDILNGPPMHESPQHFDDGGYVEYTPETLGYPINQQYSAPTPDYSQFTLPNDSQSALQNALYNNLPVGSQEQTNPVNGGLTTPAYLQNLGNVLRQGGGSSGSGGLSSILSSLLGNPSLLGSLLGGGLGLSGALGSNNGQNTMLANYNPTPPQMFQGSGPSSSNMYGNFSAQPRQRLNPSINYATAGQNPTPGGNMFYSPSGGGPTAQPSQQSPLQQYGAQMPQAQPSTQPPLSTQQLIALLSGQGGQMTGTQGMTGYAPVMHPTLQAQGGSIHEQGGALSGALTPHMTPASKGGPSYIQGPGDGTSDDIDAKLSNGEYVMDAGSVSMLGNGSNEAGAKKLDQLRENLRRHAGESLTKGKQFMKAKAPQTYLKGGQA